MNANDGTGRRILLCWDEVFSHLDSPSAGNLGQPQSGILRVPPPVGDMLITDGFWTEVNSELGTLLDEHEEESVSSEQAKGMAELIRRHASDYRGAPADQLLRRSVGKMVSPTQKILWAEITNGDMVRWLEVMAAFLADAAHKGKAVVVSL